MNAFGHLLFNVFANSVLSFVGSLGIVYAVLYVLRVRPGACRLWLLLLPFAKLVIDLAAGVPDSSFLWAKLDGHTQDHGQFSAGLGLWYFGPRLVFMLGAFSDGLIYPQSFGDLLDGALAKRFGTALPGAIALAVLMVGLVRLASRVRRDRSFLRDALRDAALADRRRVGRREVPVLVSDHYAGVPFATGIGHPCILFSARLHRSLTPAEREAAIQHELAHIAHHDLALLAALKFLADVFWFLPGMHGLLARIGAVLEQRADDRAVTSGTAPSALASALVRAGEILQPQVPGVAMVSGGTILRVRVQLLLDAPATASRTLTRVQVAVTAIVTLTIVQAIFAGNYHAALVRFSSLP